MTWRWAALMPHPPIIVPEVGGGREELARATIDGVVSVARDAAAREVDALFVLSPHQRYAPGALMVNRSPRCVGSFAPFGAPQVSFDLRTDGAAGEIARHLEGRGVPAVCAEYADLDQDQGTTVPIYFLRREFGSMPTVVLASPIGLDRDGAVALGRALASFDDGRRWGLVASADLSHRLLRGGSNGYSPHGKTFDDAIVRAMRERDPRPVMELSEEQIASAGECGMRSALAMLGLVGEIGGEIDVRSYEGPYGVGYCAAFWSAPVRSHPYARLARKTVERLLSGRRDWPSGTEIDPDPKLWETRRACFVSIKRTNGDLRGCIGTLAPMHDDLASEISMNAISASTRDPRFAPMDESELGSVVFSVDILSSPEPAEIEDLDPQRYGVIVTQGGRRGVLLPALEGVDTVEEQLRIACMKAGIRSMEGVRIERFTVERCREEEEL